MRPSLSKSLCRGTYEGKLSVRLSKDVKERLYDIARKQRRSLSSLIDFALAEWLELKEDLHPEFMADIKEAMEGVGAGEIEDYERG